MAKQNQLAGLTGSSAVADGATFEASASAPEVRVDPRLSPADADPAFEHLVLAHRDGLAVQARYLCRNRAESEDLVQEVVVKALQHRHQFQPGTNLRAWLRAIMRNTFLLRQRGRNREASFDPERAEPWLARHDDPTIAMQLDDVRRALRLLPARYRDALTLAAAGSSYDEMSCILGCAVGTVKSRLSRARDLLQAVLQEGEFKALPCSSNPAEILEADFVSLASRGEARAEPLFH
jgi:RNA polymerase sigma-70 factor (ECF subfamily)